MSQGQAERDGSGRVDARAREERPRRWPPWKRAFLESLSMSGNVTAACSRAGVGHTTVYNYRNRYSEFEELWREALDKAADLLDAEALRRAVKGVEKPVFHKGKVCGTIREYSDRLLIVLMRAARPDKYAQRRETKLTTDRPPRVHLVIENDPELPEFDELMEDVVDVEVE